MANPFNNPWDVPSSYPFYSLRKGANSARSQTLPLPKVVSVPVHFVESDGRRSASSLKIQKVFRGFLVRKSLKKISAIKSEVDKIERRISKRETVVLIRKNSNEQLKLNEVLMDLLFKLDSVRGVDCGVRDFRKAVIKKAIALQETLDAIVAGQSLGGDEEASVGSGNGDIDGDDPNRINEGIDSTSYDCFTGNYVDRNSELKKHTESNSDESEENRGVQTESMLPEAGDETRYGEDAIEDQTDADEKIKEEDVIEEDEGSVEEKGAEQMNDLKEYQSQLPTDTQSLIEDDYGLVEEAMGSEEAGGKRGNCAGDEKNGNREMLERIMDENEKMVGLMTKLFERNETQNRLLSSLSERVEQLERAFLMDKMRRKKRRQSAGTVDGFESCDQRKCGKR